MKKIQVTVECDRCGSSTGAGPDDPGTPMAFGYGGRIIDVDLCYSCNEELRELLDPLLKKGVPADGSPQPRKPRGRPERVACGVCGKEVSAGSGITLHMRAAHKEKEVSP